MIRFLLHIWPGLAWLMRKLKSCKIRILPFKISPSFAVYIVFVRQRLAKIKIIYLFFSDKCTLISILSKEKICNILLTRKKFQFAIYVLYISKNISPNIHKGFAQMNLRFSLK